ncbi:GWxTD domain-containing protein [Hymenobacter sp. CRA2]|uniref:GWxTD domain-containing protein n=1 Tax=Hymenobacter sp. CRA2 TaxID=1955620 RepID=UPI00098EA213|nr:GWxTD domain-containing protein [Hymenobacter sp. CRA2]OON66196.1 hypothetical protein B0919_22155 [Hymenobacter sp. CRA2]
MRYLWIFLWLVSTVAASAQRLPIPWRLDYSELYQSGPHPSIDARREGDSLRLYVRFPAGTAPRADQALRVVSWGSYESRQPGWQENLGAFGSTQQGTDVTVSFCVPLAPLAPASLLVVGSTEALSSNTGSAVWLRLTPEVRTRPFILTDSAGRPLFRRYLRSGEAVRIDAYGPPGAVTVRRFPSDFTPALPPYSDPAIQAHARTLKAEATAALSPEQLFKPQEPGLYTLQVADTPPLGVLVQPVAYPEVTTAPQLIDPLRYLTTSVEREQMLGAEVPKRAVDEFWLKAGNQEQTVARLFIRSYYGRVADANRLFAAHKPGWMTDRGMLYIVLGPPDRVERSASTERWEYEGVDRRAAYVFRAKASTFASDYYELVRRPEYEWLWMRAVQQWRTGKTAPAPPAGR